MFNLLLSISPPGTKILNTFNEELLKIYLHLKIWTAIVLNLKIFFKILPDILFQIN